jgi:hypothetical protein
MHSLNLRIPREPRLPKFPPNTTLLHAPKRNPVIRIITRINPHHARLDPLRHPMRPRDILREDRAAKPVGSIVRHLQRLPLGLEASDHDERTEDLFAEDLHAGLHIREDGRCDEEAFPRGGALGECLAARDERGAFFFAGFDEAKDALVLRFRDLRALEGGLGEGVTDDGELGDLLFEGFDEVVVE